MSSSDTTDKVRKFWESKSCGARHTAKEKHSMEYFDEIESYRYTYEPFIHSFAQFTRWSGKRVLEVGVGAGTDFLQFARAGARCYGVDLTREAIDNVKARLRLYGLSAEDLTRCNAEQLPYPDNSFDLVYSWGVIHHAEDTEKVLSEINRVVRPGGFVKIMVYHLYAPYTIYVWLRNAILRGKLRGPRWAIFHHQESYGTKAYTEREIRNMLKQHPLAELKFSYCNQYVREGAKLTTLRRILASILPRRFGWYLCFQYKKV